MKKQQSRKTRKQAVTTLPNEDLKALAKTLEKKQQNNNVFNGKNLSDNRKIS